MLFLPLIAVGGAMVGYVIAQTVKASKLIWVPVGFCLGGIVGAFVDAGMFPLRVIA